MSTEINAKKAKQLPGAFNKWAYGAFVILGLYFFIIRGAASDGVMYLGIALVFDPFDQSVTWQARPFYQKAWLIAHLLMVFTLFALMLLTPATR